MVVEGLLKTSANLSFKMHKALEAEEIESENVLSYGELKRGFSRLVVLGDPGGGKSTLCQYLCYDLVKQSAMLATSQEATAADPQLQRIPFRVVLRSFEQQRSKDPGLTILDFIHRDIRNFVTSDDGSIEKTINHLLITGRAVVAFDGLDEILLTSNRREFVELVVAFCNQFPLCPTIVTSRVVGYDSAPLPIEFEQLVLDQFSDGQVKEYVTRFMKVVGDRKPNEAEKLAEQFVEQTRNNAADLRRNPLMLSLMSWLFGIRNDVPSSRPEIYSDCAVFMFERWDDDRNIRVDIPSDFDRLEMFSYIASKIFGQETLSDGVSEEWLSATVKDYLSHVYTDKSKINDATKKLLKFIVGRAWVMCEKGDSLFSFTHNTFLEYLFARSIDSRNDTVADVWRVIQPHVRRREWEVVAQLALQIKTHRNSRRQEEALQLLSKQVRDSTDPSEKAAYVAFACRTLEYINGSEAVIEDFLKTVLSAVVELFAQGKFEAGSSIKVLTSGSVDRRSFVQGVVAAFFKAELATGGAAVARLAYAITSGIAFEFTDNVLSDEHIIAKVSQEMETRLLAACREIVFSRMEESDAFATLGWGWYERINERQLKKFGVHFLVLASDRRIRSLDGLTSLVMRSSRSFVWHEAAPSSEEANVHALRCIGNVMVGQLPVPVHPKWPFGRVAGLPIAVWARQIKNHFKDPVAFAGVVFCFLFLRPKAASIWKSDNILETDVVKTTRRTVVEMGKSGRDRSSAKRVRDFEAEIFDLVARSTFEVGGTTLQEILRQGFYSSSEQTDV